jgi:hypothetical protein
MIDSDKNLSFREDWLPTGCSRDVTLSLQCYMEDVLITLDVLYYFKPLSTFNVLGLTDAQKFEDIDGYIAEDFLCDPDDIHTIASKQFGYVIIISEPALKRAGVLLPPWPNRRPAALRVRGTPPIHSGRARAVF